jgi:branched-chain amino acid transport system permease protein
LTLELTLQSAVNGLSLAAVYILVALGLTLLFSIMHILNFAHGELYMLGAFSIYYFTILAPTENLFVNYALGITLTMVLVGFLGVGIEKIFFRPVRGKPIQGMIIAMGLSMLIQGLTTYSLGVSDKGIPTIFQGVIRFGGVSLSVERFIAIIVSGGLVILLHLFVAYTKAGKAMRAIEQDPVGAALQGIRPDFTNSLAFLIAAGLAGVAGVLMAPIFIINPFMGSGLLLKAFMIIILGGLGSVSGCIAGGLIIGFMDSFVTVIVGAEVANAIGFIIVIAVILFKPRGILGHT